MCASSSWCLRSRFVVLRPRQGWRGEQQKGKKFHVFFDRENFAPQLLLWSIGVRCFVSYEYFSLRDDGRPFRPRSPTRSAIPISTPTSRIHSVSKPSCRTLTQHCARHPSRRFGADGVAPYMAYEAIAKMNAEGLVSAKAKEDYTDQELFSSYRKSIAKGILKVMSKMGISTLQSYKGAQVRACGWWFKCVQSWGVVMLALVVAAHLRKTCRNFFRLGTSLWRVGTLLRWVGTLSLLPYLT